MPTGSAPITIKAARRHGHWLWIACKRCDTGRVLEIAAIPDRFDQATVRDLHFERRFRCLGCGRPASATMVYTANTHALEPQLERWA